MENFEFTYNGKKYWYSRSMATVAFIFKLDKDLDWCVLANKRGNGTPDFQGYWNCPCGYLEHNLTLAENAAKEVFEECGLEIDPKELELVGINSDPTENHQNVTVRYSLIINSYEDLNLNTKHSEKDEVDEIKFIKLKDIEEYQWAFNHGELIKEIAMKKHLQ